MKAQAAAGWEVAGLTGGRHTAPGPDEEVIDGLRFFRTPGGNGGGLIGEWRYMTRLARRVQDLVNQFQPDLLHAHSPCLNGMAVHMALGRNNVIPLLYEIRAFWEDAAVGNGTGREGSLKYRLTRLLETRTCQWAEGVAVICEGLRGDLIKRGIPADKIIVSPNGVDLELFGDPPSRDAALATTLGIDADDDVIGFIGSFYDYEGLDDLIAAMPLLPGVKLLLVGGGPMEAALKAQAGESDRIIFAGRVPHDQVERYYSLIDILAYPRKKMRLTDLVTPLKPLEAMAQRRLVAASDVGGHRELIEDGVTGTLFPPDDPVALAESLRALLANRERWPERRDVAREYVERSRNWSSNISRYLPMYRRLTGRMTEFEDA